jgi:urea transporter
MREVKESDDADGAGFFELLTLEMGSVRSIDVRAKRAELSPIVLASIREIFQVFFEGSDHADASEEDYASGKIMWTIYSFISSFNATMPWIQRYLDSEILLFIELCLRGISQVFFQNNSMSGLFILVGLFIQSTRVAIHGVVALVCGNLIALILGFDKGLVRSGLFGYNSLLVGLALATFDSTEKHRYYNVYTLLAAVVFSSFSSVVFVMIGKLLGPYKSPPLTLPFNVATMTFLLASANMGRVEMNSVRVPALPDYNAAGFSGISASEFLAGTIRGIGQVYLADNLISGCFVLAGIAICSRIAAAAAFLGSALGAAVALATGVPGSMVELGMYGFNASLSVTAMFIFYVPSIGAATLAVLAGTMTVFGQHALATLLEPFGLPFLTLPFCVIALPFIILQGTTSMVISVPLEAMTVPEDHVEKVNALVDGFSFLKEAIAQEQAPRIVKSQSWKVSFRSRSKLSLAIDDDEDEETGQSGRFCGALCKKKKKHSAQEIKTKEDALAIFESLNHLKTGELSMDDVTSAFQAAGLTDREPLHFAGLILVLLDTDGSHTIDPEEFVAFALVARAIHVIRRKVTKFFDFVDIDGDACIDFDEIDSALQYIGRPILEEVERRKLVAMTSCVHEEDGIDVEQLINLVTVAKVKALLNEYHNNQTLATEKDPTSTSIKS